MGTNLIHYLYKTINLINGKIYLGMHSADEAESFNLYKGSGKFIKLAFKKYGKENFSKEIISYHNSRKELEEAEKTLITEDIVKDRNYYNAKKGGEGGSGGLSEESKAKISKANKGRLIGNKNPMWGKTHTSEAIAKGKAKHSLYGKPSPQGCRISINGIVYPSFFEAAKNSEFTPGGIRQRVLSSKYLNYRFVDESKNTHKTQKFVKINQAYYESLRKAEEQTGIPRKLIADNIKNSIEGCCYETLTSLHRC